MSVVRKIFFLGAICSCAEVGQPEAPCLESINALSAEEEAGAYGHSAARSMAALAGEYQADLQWVAGDVHSTTVYLLLNRGVLEARYVEAEVNPEYSGGDLKLCYDRLEVVAEAAFGTHDLAFQEDVSVLVEADNPDVDVAGFRIAIPTLELQGMYDPDPGVESVRVHGTIAPNADRPHLRFTGSILVPEEEHGLVEIATWPPSTE